MFGNDLENKFNHKSNIYIYIYIYRQAQKRERCYLGGHRAKPASPFAAYSVQWLSHSKIHHHLVLLPEVVIGIHLKLKNPLQI